MDRVEWERAREELLVREKELTRARDALSEVRRALPWERVEKRYAFDGPAGEVVLEDLFAGRSQLLVYHFMFGPTWDAGCKSCSFWADNIERNVVHLAARDATVVAISRGPLAKLEAFKKRMGWTFPWLSSARSDFNFDFGVSFDPEAGRPDAPTYNYRPKTGSMTELPGVSVFARDPRDPDAPTFHTYSTYARGIETINAGYSMIDLLPKGRDEAELEFPGAWIRHRDSYGAP